MEPSLRWLVVHTRWTTRKAKAKVETEGCKLTTRMFLDRNLDLNLEFLTRDYE